MSKIVGDELIERRSWSNDVDGGRRSISGQSNNEALVPYFLSRLPKYGSALMIHSNTPPAHVQGRPWWKIKRLAAMVPEAPSHAGSEQPAGSGPWRPTPKREGRRPVVPVPVVANGDDGQLALLAPQGEVA